MNKDKANKKELLELITKILTDDNTTVSDFIERLDKTFSKLKKENDKRAEKAELNEKENKELLRVANVTVNSKTPAIFIAGCEDDDGCLKELAVFAQGKQKAILPLLGSAVYSVLKESDVSVEEFAKAMKFLEE